MNVRQFLITVERWITLPDDNITYFDDILSVTKIWNVEWEILHTNPRYEPIPTKVLHLYPNIVLPKPVPQLWFMIHQSTSSYTQMSFWYHMGSLVDSGLLPAICGSWPLWNDNSSICTQVLHPPIPLSPWPTTCHPTAAPPMTHRSHFRTPMADLWVSFWFTLWDANSSIWTHPYQSIAPSVP